MKVQVLLLAIAAFITFIPSLLQGFEANEMGDSEQFTRTLYEDLLEELNGAHLRIAATHVPPAMIIEKDWDGTLHFSGYSADACLYLSQLFKFTYTYVIVVEEELKEGGPIEAESNLLMRNEVDITSADIQLFWSLFNAFDVSIPLYTSGTALMVPWPQEESRILAPIYPFQPTVWLVILVVIMIMAMVFTWIPLIYQKMIAKIGITNNTNQQQRVIAFSFGELSNQAFAIAANITGHAGSWSKIVAKKLFFKILLGFWFLSILVLINAYSSLLISFLTIPTLKPVAKSYDDFSFRNVQGLEPIAGKNTLLTNMITLKSSSSGEMNKWQKRGLVFAKFYRQHPENLFTTSQQRFDLMWTGRYALSTIDLKSTFLLDELNKKAGYCRFTLSSKHLDDLIDYHHFFLFKKNWRYTDAMRNKIRWWLDTGLALKWIKSYQPSAKGCLFEDYKKNAPAIRVLTLKDLWGAFAVLLMGLALSLLVFLIEKIHYYRMIRRRSV